MSPAQARCDGSARSTPRRAVDAIHDLAPRAQSAGSFRARPRSPPSRWRLGRLLGVDVAMLALAGAATAIGADCRRRHAHLRHGWTLAYCGCSSSCCCWARAASTARASAPARSTTSGGSSAPRASRRSSLLALAAAVAGSGADDERSRRSGSGSTRPPTSPRGARRSTGSQRRDQAGGRGRCRPTLIVGAGRVGAPRRGKRLPRQMPQLGPVSRSAILDKDPLAGDGSGAPFARPQARARDRRAASYARTASSR